jgi:hypothetical protein
MKRAGRGDERRTIAVRYQQAVRDQVRVAYGAVPISLAGLPADDPFRAAIRDQARSLLVAWGYLTEEELRILPIQTAIVAALHRCRGEMVRPDQERVPRSERRSSGVAPRIV